jgi:hypothetical protein
MRLHGCPRNRSSRCGHYHKSLAQRTLLTMVAVALQLWLTTACVAVCFAPKPPAQPSPAPVFADTSLLRLPLHHTPSCLGRSSLRPAVLPPASRVTRPVSSGRPSHPIHTSRLKYSRSRSSSPSLQPRSTSAQQ